MATFTDDFERGDGGLGNNWTVHVGTAAISSGKVYTQSGARCSNSGINASGRQEILLTVTYAVNGDLVVAPFVKMNDTGNQGYYVVGGGTLASPTWQLNRMTAGTPTSLRYGSSSGVSTGTHVLRLLYQSGVLSFWVDGAFVMSYSDSTYGSNTGAGFFSGNGLTVVSAITVFGNETVSFTVSPDPIPNYGQPTTVTFTGVGTAWTTGTPGSPTFTVDNGALSDQEVLSATSATATYTPGNFLGTATFADPSTGATDTATVTSDTSVVPPGGDYQLSRYAIAMLNNTAEESLVEVLTKPNTPVDVDAEATLEVATILGRVALTTGAKVNPSNIPDAGVLDTLWAIINGRYDRIAGPYPTPTFDTVDEGLTHLADVHDTLITGNNYTLGSVITNITGEGVPTIHDVMDAIAAIEGGSNQDVLDALAAMRGDEVATLAGVVALLDELATAAGYNLSDVLTAISAIPTNPVTSLQPVLDAIGLVQPNTAYTLSTIAAQATNLQGDVTDLSIEVAAVKAIVEGLADAIASLSGAPVWPGDANVTLGTEVALSNGLVIDGPMHGLLITITGQPVQPGRYRFGAVNSWMHVGAVMFGSDRGDYERPESFSIDTQVICPRAMKEADTCIVRVNEGWTGTVRPWSRTA